MRRFLSLGGALFSSAGGEDREAIISLTPNSLNLAVCLKAQIFSKLGRILVHPIIDCIAYKIMTEVRPILGF